MEEANFRKPNHEQNRSSRELTQVEVLTQKEKTNPRRIPFNTAEPSPEIVQVIREQGLDEDKIEGWLAVPSIMPPLERVSRSEILNQGLVDAYGLLEPFLEMPVAQGTLRTIDVLNGCGHHCDTCLADAALPTQIFSYESLQKLFGDSRFIQMLQPDSLRFGSSGDIMDHPQAVDIIRLSLDSTVSLDEAQQRQGKRYKIKIFTNYRPNHEEELDKLFQLAREYPDRLRVTVSLPFNRSDTVNHKFADFASKRPDVFAGSLDEQGFFHSDWFSESGLKNVGIQDVRHPRVLFMTGRVMSEEANAGRVPKWDMVDNDRFAGYADRGFVKTYLNPNALWLMGYVTPYESHTGRVFTPLSRDNIDALSHLPYHPDFPTPPNWTGGTGTPKDSEASESAREEMEKSGRIKKNVVIVG